MDNIIKSMIDTLVVISPEQKIVLANPAACTLLGYDETELIGKPGDMIFYDGSTSSNPIIDEIFAKRFVSNVETAYLKKDDGKILVMDDDEIVRSIVGSMLTKLGYTVDFAVNGEEALEKYEKAMKSENAFEVVILDLTIKGGMGGEETIGKMVELDSAVTAIVSSGYSDGHIMANHTNYGFKGTLAKPFRISELSESLHNLTRSKNAGMSRFFKVFAITPDGMRRCFRCEAILE